MGAKKTKEEYFEQVVPMNTSVENYVVMKNDLIKGKSTLSLNATKLLRLTIMQCVISDTGFKPYQISIQDFAKLLQIGKDNLYKEVQSICIQLLKNVVLIGDGNPKHKWDAFQWVTHCGYDGNGTITIQLHDDMKPYVLGLKSHYTQYEIDSILYLKSTYAVRIYELIKMEMKNFQPIGNKEKTIYLSVDTIRKATGTENKLKQHGQFKEKVIDIALKEINSKPFGMQIDYDYEKEGRKIIGYNFKIKSSLNGIQLTEEQQARLEVFEEKQRLKAMGQMDIFDYPEYLPE